MAPLQRGDAAAVVIDGKQLFGAVLSVRDGLSHALFTDGYVRTCDVALALELRDELETFRWVGEPS